MGKEAGSEQERHRAHRLAEQKITDESWEMIRGSQTDCLKMDDEKITIALPLVVQANDRDVRIREVFGKMNLYRLCAKKQHAAKHREEYDIVTARAVANLSILAELCVPLLKKDGLFLAMKGAQGHEQ
jgi:Predicted S-adenosylmethionine-dependent methyltransferase involved in bacterial cell division